MELQYPKCPKCGSRTTKKGFEPFSNPPHDRQKYRCTECKYIFVPKITQDGMNEPQ